MMDFFPGGTNESLGFSFIDDMELDHMDEDIVNGILSQERLSFSLEDEISLMQADDLLGPCDRSYDLPGLIGIEATDVGSLLEQFEEVSQTLQDCDVLAPTFNSVDTLKYNSESIITDTKKPTETAESKKDNHLEKERLQLSKDLVEKLKSSSKPKSTVLLPMGVPSKRGKGRAMASGRPVAMPSNCTPLRLQRVMMQNQELRDSIPFEDPPKVKADKVEKETCNTKRKAENGEFLPNDNYFALIGDHDYSKNVPAHLDGPVDTVVSIGNTNLISTAVDSPEPGEIIVEDEVEIETTEMPAVPGKPKKLSYQKYLKRRAEQAKAEQAQIDEKKYFDKIPSYYTALSIPPKHVKKSKTDKLTKSGISIHDFIPRDPSPERDRSIYNKLPDYCSTFTNSTKYDNLSAINNGDKFDDNLHDSRIGSSGYSSRSETPLLLIDSRRTSRSPSTSKRSASSPSRCRHSSSSKFPRRSRRSEKRRTSYSSCSECSRSSGLSSCSRSRSRSRSYSRPRSGSRSHSRSSSSSSCSRSRSRSKNRSWKRERQMRRNRRYRNRSRSRSYSRSRSRSPGYRRRRNKYRSRSSSNSRSRSYSRSRSPRRDRKRLQSEERRQEKKKAKEDEQNRRIADRRIVYVGCLPDSYTKRDMRKRFGRFGEIEEIRIHLREHGDNYGFITYLYTCDAYAAIEKGNSVPGEPNRFDLCFGGRRQFCKTNYADLDGNKEIQEEFEPPIAKGSLDFDELLKMAKKKLPKS